MDLYREPLHNACFADCLYSVVLKLDPNPDNQVGNNAQRGTAPKLYPADL